MSEETIDIPGVDVVIVNWNAGDCLRSCLAALARARRESFRFQSVVVVDNGSSDASLEALDDLGLPLRVLRNERNRGFAAACNQGAAVGDGELVLFLNPDTEVSPEAIDLVVGFLTDPAN